MCSATAPRPASDLTPAARIRDAAMALLAEHGPEGTSVRAIAAEAGMSAPSVIRIYGSKEQLQAAVDDHVIARVGEILERVLTVDDLDGARSAVVALAGDQQLLAYLGRALADGSQAGRALFDRLYEISLSFVESTEEAGLTRPVDDRAGVAAWLLVADLGMLCLRSHIERALGVDPCTPTGWDRIAAVEIDLLSKPYLMLPDSAPDDSAPGDHHREET